VSARPLAPWESALIQQLPVARLATVAPDGSPHAVPVCYAVADGRFVIPIDEKPKSTTRLARLRNIENEPRVSLLFDRYDDDWTRLAWVRVDGQASVLERGSSMPGALAELRARYAQYGNMALEELPLIVVEPVSVRSWRWPND
jgi:PPOX class probable F420-dependent enzyme